jgi:hypothetical protein
MEFLNLNILCVIPQQKCVACPHNTEHVIYIFITCDIIHIFIIFDIIYQIKTLKYIKLKHINCVCRCYISSILSKQSKNKIMYLINKYIKYRNWEICMIIEIQYIVYKKKYNKS